MPSHGQECGASHRRVSSSRRGAKARHAGAWRRVRASALSGTDRLTLSDVRRGFRFIAALPGLLRHPMTVTAARAILARRLAQRETDFIALMRRAVFGSPRSPYRRLFGLAVSEFLAAIGARPGAARMVERIWRDAGLLRVERRVPIVGASGKVLHCHVEGRSAARNTAPGTPP